MLLVCPQLSASRVAQLQYWASFVESHEHYALPMEDGSLRISVAICCDGKLWGHSIDYAWTFGEVKQLLGY